jgi:hypothetical protein
MFLHVVKLIHNICLFLCCSVVTYDPGLSTLALYFGLYYAITCHKIHKKNKNVLNLNATHKTNSKNQIPPMVL